ncbi:hypothetical protein CIT292_08587 [Citrobacter youngae ATCC 29220]|uniref:Uncharacterized protein n=1 Tax=Citrobacter youngae ATCC 29220 TaxID=500640 RepID=D4BDM0_9ENTR|nr:hypothetical protein CIT292_08587 [Citrobacter youngae ATCC 29220]
MSQPSPEISGDREPPAANRRIIASLENQFHARYTLQSRNPCAF